MTKPELDATPEFDCLMVCLLLTLSWDERLLKKLFRHKWRNPLRSEPLFHSKICGFLRKAVVKNQNRAILI